MELQQAIEVLTLLADGIDPITGEILPKDSVYNQVEIVRALYCVLGAAAPKEKQKKQKRQENAGKFWTAEDDKLLAEMYDAGSSVREMSTHFKRSYRAIQARLVRLGKITERYELYRMK